jgi:beta-carotene 3-hydroxylase
VRGPLAFLAGLAGMEAVAWASHRFLMHGSLWFLHKSHHARRRGGLEGNDAFGLFFSAVSIALVGTGVRGRPNLVWLGAGMTAYGLAYLVFHDVMVHGRFGRVGLPRHPYMLRLVRAHRLHHCGGARDGTRNFGFLFSTRAAVLPFPESIRQPAGDGAGLRRTA